VLGEATVSTPSTVPLIERSLFVVTIVTTNLRRLPSAP
jgi:hypothetical protein